MPLQLKKFTFSPFMENTYAAWDENTRETAIIDPGCYDINERQVLSNFLREENLDVKYLINTHCHIDHIFGNAYVKESYNVEFMAPEKDLFLMDKAVEQAEIFGVEIQHSPQPDKLIVEGSSINLGDIRGEFLFTPGHTPGEFCVYFPEEKICFTGDVLFMEGIGRTDLWGGDFDTLINSITEKLFTLPDDVIIYPGHGEKSTRRRITPFYDKNHTIK